MARRAPTVAAGASVSPGFAAYYRVSTDKQGRSGLGLEAQREAVARHIQGVAGRLIGEFEEVESGKRNDRPQLRAALYACRARRATLLIAKLDRLSRNLAFLANLMESGVEFVACDNPHATRFTIHILAAVAEHEREMISRRTTDALAAKKARGEPLGNPKLRTGSREMALAACRVRQASARDHAAALLPAIEAARKAGAVSLGKLAAALTARGFPTPTGAQIWRAQQVKRILKHIKLQ